MGWFEKKFTFEKAKQEKKDAKGRRKQKNRRVKLKSLEEKLASLKEKIRDSDFFDDKMSLRWIKALEIEAKIAKINHHEKFLADRRKNRDRRDEQERRSRTKKVEKLTENLKFQEGQIFHLLNNEIMIIKKVRKNF